MASSSNSPCAACKFLRRKCMNECVFAPYFPPDQPQKFANVHKVFGASNVAKLLNDILPAQREDAVNSLAYEAEARLRDPVYGCVGLISFLQNKLQQVQVDLYNAKKELASYIGPSAMMPITHPASAAGIITQPPHQSTASAASMVVQYGVSAMGHGIPTGPQTHAAAHVLMREHQHQQQQQHMMETHQLAAAVREQELMRNYEHHQELARYNSGFDASSVVGPASSFNQMGGRSGSHSTLALVSFDNSFQVEQEPAQQQQHPYQQQQLPQQQRAGSEDGRSSVGPSS